MTRYTLQTLTFTRRERVNGGNGFIYQDGAEIATEEAEAWRRYFGRLIHSGAEGRHGYRTGTTNLDGRSEEQSQFWGRNSRHHAVNVRMIENMTASFLTFRSITKSRECGLQWDLRGHNRATCQGANQ
jgi:hypothetical protein